jgi:Bacterial PH domain
LTPEEVYYEGPPAITETIIPTISILTVVGIIPAIASWSRQAWVRYKITTRRIRVTSGIGGKDMAEIVVRRVRCVIFVCEIKKKKQKIHLPLSYGCFVAVLFQPLLLLVP